MVDLQRAYASCQRVAAAHSENFPVASAVIPRAMRRHIAAVYAFARTADDFADEDERPAEERYRLLDGWGARLRAAAAGRPADPVPGEPEDSADIFRALGATIQELRLPVRLFEDLLSAFRQDVSVSRYETWTDLLDYCRRSANPVGRLVLRMAGVDDEASDAQSDALCTALQLTNFWQDLQIDFLRGRIYMPREELRAHGAIEIDLACAPLTPEWRSAVRAATVRTRALFEAGRPLCGRLRGRLGYELRATWLGGTRILDGLEAAGFDPLARRPRLRRTDLPWFAWKLVTWG